MFFVTKTNQKKYKSLLKILRNPDDYHYVIVMAAQLDAADLIEDMLEDLNEGAAN